MKTVTKLFAFALILCSTSFGAPFQNGSFELPDIMSQGQVMFFESGKAITGWLIGGTGPTLTWHNGPSQDSPLDAFEGKYLIAFNGGGSEPGRWIEQTFDTEPGVSYVVGFAVARSGHGGTTRVTAEMFSDGGQSLGTLDAVPPDDPTFHWLDRITFVFTAPSAHSRLRFTDASVDTPGADILLDSVSVTELILPNGLTSYYPFNGDAKDESGNGNDGTIHGAELTRDRFGQPDRALSFDGVSAYVEMQRPLPDSNSASVSLWAKIEQPNGNRSFLLFEADSTEGRDFGISFSQGEVTFFTKDNTSLSTPLKTNQWYHLIFVADATAQQKEIWIDGELGAIGAFSGPANFGYHHALQLGRLADGAFETEYYKGLLDDIRVYERPLKADEIKQLYAFERFHPSLEIHVQIVRVVMHVLTGKTYQLESSNDLSHWTAVGTPFVASADEVTQDFDVTQSGRYFRLYAVK